jgi:hypothetical protein
MAIDEPNFSTVGCPIQEDEWVIFLKILKGLWSPKSPDSDSLLTIVLWAHPGELYQFFTVAGLGYNEAGSGTLSFPLEILEGITFLNLNEKYKKTSSPKN